MRNYFLDLDQVMELVMDSWPGLGEGHQTAGQGDRGSAGGNKGGEESRGQPSTIMQTFTRRIDRIEIYQDIFICSFIV